jgi:hypothetical protein
MGAEGGPRCRILTSEVWRRDLKYPMKIKTDFAYDSDGIGKGGTATVFIDHKKVAKGRIEGTVPVVFSKEEGLDVGKDSGIPVNRSLTTCCSSSKN